jgi:hypothetical protein
MTTIPEKKSEFVFIFGFMIVVALLVAWRAENAPLITTVCIGIAAGLAVLTIRWYRKPTPFLAISPDEIWYGRLNEPGQKIERNATGRLYFREGFQKGGWYLLPADQPGAVGLLMTGFDMGQVAAACEAHGWTFADPDRS